MHFPYLFCDDGVVWFYYYFQQTLIWAEGELKSFTMRLVLVYRSETF